LLQSTTAHKRSNSRHNHQHQHHNDAGASRLPQNGDPVAVELPPDGYVPHTSGYFYNVMTGFFFDTKTSYYFIFDAPSQRFLFYDYKVKTYRVYPPESVDAAKPAFLAPAALVNPDVDAQPPSGEAAAAAAAAVATAPQEYKKGAKPLKMTLTAKKAATNMAQWNRMKEIDTEAPPATLDAFVKATEEDNDAADEAEAAQRRVRNTGRAPVVDVQPRPMSAQYSSLGRGPKNPTAADVPCAPSEVTVAPPVLVTMTSVIELTSTVTPATTTSTPAVAVDQFDTLSVLASGNVACTLCQRQFPNRDKAEKHVTMSALHAGNVEARDNAAREAATLAAEQVRQREQRQVDDRRTVKQRERDAREEMLAVERRLAERAAQGLLAPPPPVDPNGPKISDDNVGNQMLRKMGWREGTGLGAQGSGIVAPVQASGGAGSLGGIGSSSRFTASATASSYSAHARDRASQRFDAIVQAEQHESK
jgi:RNA-binding protein 5/10